MDLHVHSGIVDPFIENFQNLKMICYNMKHFQIWSVYRKRTSGPNTNTFFQITLILRRDRPPHLGKGGRLYICVKNSLIYSQINIPSKNRMEVMGITSGDLHIFNVYNPPSNNTLDTSALNQMTRYRKVLICRDFNCHHDMWGSSAMNRSGRALISFIENHDYVLLNTTSPTHFTLDRPDHWNLLDLTITSNSISRNCSVQVTNEFLDSDHSIINIHINHVQPTPNHFLPRWNFTKADWPAFNRFCYSTLSIATFQHLSASAMCSTFWGDITWSCTAISSRNKILQQNLRSLVDLRLRCGCEK